MKFLLFLFLSITTILSLDTQFVLYEESGAVGIITINRPKALNALNSQVLDELSKVLDNIDTSKIRALILTGAGEKSFVAGADIGEMSTLTKQQGEAFSKKGNDIFRRLEVFPIPIIASVNGYALRRLRTCNELRY